MLLKGRTDHKKLNLNRRILSVRRCSQEFDQMKIRNALPVIPRHPSSPEKAVPVKSPGNVPFQWEKIPGKRKEHLKPQTQEEITNICDSGDCDEASVDASGSLYSDLQTRELRRDTFLPADKAMVLQSSVGEELPPQRKMRVVNKECDNHGNWIATFGFLPRFCSKSSVCIINHVPAISVKSKTTLPSSTMKLKSPPSLADSFTGTENEYVVKKSVGEIQTDELYCETPISFLEKKQVLCFLEETKRNRIKGLESHSKGSKTFMELLLAEEGSPKKTELVASVVEKSRVLDSGEEDNNISTKGIDKKVWSSHDFNMVSSIDKSNIKWGVDIDTSVDLIEVAEKEDTKSLSNFGAPPLPKSPSDSWLWRTLPSMRNNMSLRLQNHGYSNAPKVGIKWESIVLSTKVQLQNLHYSEDILTPIPKT